MAINAFTGVAHDTTSNQLLVDGTTDTAQFEVTRIDVVVIDAGNEDRRLEKTITGPKEGDPISSPWFAPIDQTEYVAFAAGDMVNVVGLATSASGDTFLWGAAAPSLEVPVSISLKS